MKPAGDANTDGQSVDWLKDFSIRLHFTTLCPFVKSTPANTTRREVCFAMFISHQEIARELGISRATVKKWISQGKLPAVRFGKQKRIPRKAFESWLQHLVEYALRGVQSDDRGAG